jgi:GR25 family glycosyltransferase involved in LPS biosynthesis
MKPAPIVIFAYNRPWHLSQMLESLRNNFLAEESHITIFCDGPKQGAGMEDLQRIEEVRSIARSQTWAKRLDVIASEVNKGLANSVIDGVSKILDQYGRIIVVEDDVILSPYFLEFMNDALEVYENESRVLSIGSWNYFYHPDTLKNNFFLTMPDTIAWATWSRSWNLFRPDSKNLLQELNAKGLTRKFNLDGQYDFETMLKAQAEGKISSWAIRWTAVAVLNNTLSLYPARALSKHAGFGTDATNCFGMDFNSNLNLADERMIVERQELIYSKQAEEAWMHIERDVIGSDAVLHYPFFSSKNIQRIRRRLTSVIKGRF